MSPDTVGGCPLQRAVHNTMFLLFMFLMTVGNIVPSARKKGGMAMVSYSDLFQFCLLIVAIISLVYKIAQKK